MLQARSQRRVSTTVYSPATITRKGRNFQGLFKRGRVIRQRDAAGHRRVNLKKKKKKNKETRREKIEEKGTTNATRRDATRGQADRRGGKGNLTRELRTVPMRTCLLLPHAFKYKETRLVERRARYFHGICRMFLREAATRAASSPPLPPSSLPGLPPPHGCTLCFPVVVVVAALTNPSRRPGLRPFTGLFSLAPRAKAPTRHSFLFKSPFYSCR